MTGIDKNLEALAEKEYLTDSLPEDYYIQQRERLVTRIEDLQKELELVDMIIWAGQKSRMTSHEQR